MNALCGGCRIFIKGGGRTIDCALTHITNAKPEVSKGPISLAWRLVCDSSLRWLRRRLRDVSWRLAGYQGSRGKLKHWRHFPVSSRYRRRLRDVSENCWIPKRLRRRCGDVPATCGRIGCYLWRRLREVALVRAQAIFWSPELPRLISRGSRGDVSASEIGPLRPESRTRLRGLEAFGGFGVL